MRAMTEARRPPSEGREWGWGEDFLRKRRMAGAAEHTAKAGIAMKRPSAAAQPRSGKCGNAIMYMDTPNTHCPSVRAPGSGELLVCSVQGRPWRAVHGPSEACMAPGSQCSICFKFSFLQ